MQNTIFQGEDRKLIFSIIGDDDAPQPINTLNDIIIHIISTNISRVRLDQSIIDRYSLQSRDCYGSINIEDNSQGEVSILLLRDKTKFYPPGIIYSEVLIKRPDAEFSQGFHSLGNLELFKVRGAKTAPIQT